MKRPLIAILTGLLLCMNVNAQELKKATADFSDYISLLKKSGYEIYSFDISSLKDETYLISFMVKEYSNGELVCEGVFLNGELYGKSKLFEKGKLLYEFEIINGKMKIYQKDELIYEGTMCNGHRLNGVGKEYNDNGELIFEGEYYNGYRWNGKGKEFNEKGELTYEGEYFEGKKKR